MQYKGPITPRLSMNEIVEFKTSKKMYTVSFIYPDRLWEFELVKDKKDKKSQPILKRLSEQAVADLITSGEIITIKNNVYSAFKMKSIKKKK